MSGQPWFRPNLRLRLFVPCLGAALMTLVLFYVMTLLIMPGQDIPAVDTMRSLDGFRVRLLDPEPRRETPETSRSSELLRPVRPETRSVQSAESRPAVRGNNGPASAASLPEDVRTPASTDDHPNGVEGERRGVDWWGELERAVPTDQNDGIWLTDRGLRPDSPVMSGRSPKWAEHGGSEVGRTRRQEAWTSVYGDVEFALNEHCTLRFPRNDIASDFERPRPALMTCRERHGFRLDLLRAMRPLVRDRQGDGAVIHHRPREFEEDDSGNTGHEMR